MDSTCDAAEHFSENEKLLYELLRTHPPCSAELLRHEVLQHLSSMCEHSPISLGSLEVVGKSHDDQYLRPPIHGERSCVRGSSCMCNFVAKVRYGADTDMAFVGVEFLRPLDAQTWKRSGSYPPVHGRCLLCTRYMVTFLYTMARCNPRFGIGPVREQLVNEGGEALIAHTTPVEPKSEVSTVAVASKQSRSRRRPKTSNASLVSVDAGEGCEDASGFFAVPVPMFASAVSVEDGYHLSKLLFFDEEFMNTTLMRDTPLGNLAFRPFVRFCSTDYKYTRDEDGRSRIVQCGMSCWTHLNGSAPSDSVRPGAPSVHAQ